MSTSGMDRVAEVVRSREEPSPKSLDSSKNFKPQHMLFCRDIKICCDLRNFWKTQKKVFLVKDSVLGQEVHYYMAYIAYHTEVNLQICNYEQK